MNLHCNRCGAVSTELAPDASSASWGAGEHDGSLTEMLLPLVCPACANADTPLHYCARCGHETPTDELTSSGRCDWCRAADLIPFEEPDDDAWWEGKLPSPE